MVRHMAGDTTLSVTDYYYLYYGHALVGRYDPFEEIPAEKRLKDLLQRQRIDLAGAREMIVLATEVLESDPFSPLSLNCLAYAYAMIGDTLSAAICNDRCDKLMEAMRLSGDGLTENTPIYIIRYGHADDIVRADGYEINRRLAITDRVGYVTFRRRDGDRTRGYYFDYSLVLRNMPKDILERPRGWQFNNIPI
jgi:hypothetical protein